MKSKTEYGKLLSKLSDMGAEELASWGLTSRDLSPEEEKYHIESVEKYTKSLVPEAISPPKSVSVDERKRLHGVLDALLNQREYLEKWTSQAETFDGLEFYQVIGWPARDLHLNASSFLHQLMGEEVRSAALLAGDTELEFFAETAKLLTPLFRKPTPASDAMKEFHSESSFNFEIEEVMEDLVGICLGDEPRTFKIAKRKKGQPLRPFRISLLRSRALYWEALLKHLEHPTRERHQLIADAFNTDFETIRKWKNSAVQVLSQQGYDRAVSLRYVPAHYVERSLSDFASDVSADGEKYWAEKSNVDNSEK